MPLPHRKRRRLAEAREKSATPRKLALAGRDPIAERDREKRRIPAFAEAVEAAHEEFAKGWAPKHAAALMSSLKMHGIPSLGPHRADVTDHAMVCDAQASIWTETR